MEVSVKCIDLSFTCFTWPWRDAVHWKLTEPLPSCINTNVKAVSAGGGFYGTLVDSNVVWNQYLRRDLILLACFCLSLQSPKNKKKQKLVFGNTFIFAGHPVWNVSFKAELLNMRDAKVFLTFPKVLHALSQSIINATFKFGSKRWRILQMISLLQGILVFHLVPHTVWFTLFSPLMKQHYDRFAHTFENRNLTIWLSKI